MSKIYEGDVKLNNIQVCEKIKGAISQEHINVLAVALKGNGYSKDAAINHKKIFAHAVLDSYKAINGEDDDSMNTKKCLKHLMEKYMKSQSNMDGEDSAFKVLIEYITENAED